MINGSDMLNVRKSFQSTTLQLIQDVQHIIARHNDSIIHVFVPKLVYYTTDWHTMAIYFRSRSYYATIDKNLVKLNGIDGFILQIVVDKNE